MFERTAVVANRWMPADDPSLPEDDYCDLDVDRWAAELWATEVIGSAEVPYAHGCNEACDDGCTQPYVPERPTGEADLQATGDLPAGTALITEAVTGRFGADLAGFLTTVPTLAGLDGWSVIEVMKGFEKVARWAAAGQLAAVAEIARRYPDPRAGWARDAEPPTALGGFPSATAAEAVSGPTFDQATAQVAFALDMPRSSAQGLLVDAVALAERVPTVRERLAKGSVSTRVARVIAQETMVCADPATAARVAEHVLAQPGVRTGAQARKATASAVITADPTAAHRRERAAKAGRSFRPVKDTTDGMTTWDVCLPVAESIEIDRRLSALAKAARGPNDRRSRAAARADVATALLLGQPVTAPDGSPLAPANLPTAMTWRTDVVVPASTLSGGDEPGHVPGWGPVTAPTARRLATGCPAPLDADDDITASLAFSLAGDSEWRRLVTDPLSGIVLDYGTTRYRPPAPLADYVRARDGHCYEPGCTVPAAECDLDHIRNSPVGPSPHPDPGGATADWNLGSGCRTAHRIKAMPGWTMSSPAAGTFTWTTPTGHRYTRHLEPPLPPPLGPNDRMVSGARRRSRPRRDSAEGADDPPPY